jgi:hypothetical protein
MYQSSGYISHLSSIDPGSFGTGFTTLMSGVHLDVIQWLAPLHCGTVTHIEAMAYKVLSPAEKPVNYELWRANSGANFYAIPTSGGQWDLLCTALLYPSSLTGTTPATATWLSMAVDTPVFVDNRGGFPNALGSSLDVQNIGQSVLHGYAIKITRTAANSDGSATNMVRAPFVGSFDLNPFGNVAGTSGTRLAGENFADTPVRLYGLRQVNSQFLDLPIEIPWRVGVSSYPPYATLTLNSGSFKRRGNLFTGVGSKITRILANLGIDYTSSGDALPWASIWTVHATSGTPDTCLGSSHLRYSWEINIGSGDAGDTAFPFMFTFSGGVNITSGSDYAAIIESDTRSLATTRAVKMPRVKTTINSYKTFNYDTGAAAWTVGSGFQHGIEIFYVDSGTVNAFSASVGGGGGGNTAFRRLYPIPSPRQYPSISLREFPRA